MDRLSAGKQSPTTGHLVLAGASIVATIGLWNLQHCGTLEEARELLETGAVATAAAGGSGQVSAKGAASNESWVLWSGMPTSGSRVLCSAGQQIASPLRL